MTIKTKIERNMTHDEMRAAIEIIAGGTYHGYLKAAATALEVSDRTIYRAYSQHSCSKKLTVKIRDMAVLAVKRQEKALSTQAGRWSTGHVETRQGGTDVVDESVVLHLATPSFSFHIEMLRGKTESGDAKWAERVRWYDEPLDEDQREVLLTIAREKGQSSIYDRSQASAEIGMRAHKMKLAEDHGAMEREELIKLSPLALSAEAEGVDFDLRLAEMQREIAWHHDQLGHNLCRASVNLGKWMMAYNMANIATLDANQTFLPAYIASKAYRLLPKAHSETKRGQKANAGGGVHDARVGDEKWSVDAKPTDIQGFDSKERTSAAVRAHFEAKYSYNALRDHERQIFNKLVKK